MKQVSAIISGDWHLMEEERIPPCRTDSIWDAQWNKVQQIKELQELHNCEVLLSGDLFDHWKTSPNLLNACFHHMPEHIRTVIGNHDLPQHNIDLLHKSGIEVLFQAGVLAPILSGGNWGKEAKELQPEYLSGIPFQRILVWHTMTYKHVLPYPGCEDPQCNKLFELFPKADLIVTGHNHTTFTARKGKQLLLNPGSLTRHDANQIDHKPCVFLYYAEDNTFDTHYLKINENVISRAHIENKNRKEQQINSFMEKLQGSWKVSLSFEENIERALKENKVPIQIKEIILNWIDR